MRLFLAAARRSHASTMERLGARILLMMGVLAVISAPLLMLGYRSTLTPLTQILAPLISCALGVTCVLASTLLRRGRAQAAYAVVLSAGFVVSVVFAALTQTGVHSVALGFLLVVIASAGVLLSARWAVGLGVAGALALMGLYYAEMAGLIAGRAAVQNLPVISRTLTVLLTIVISTLMAVLFARLVVNALRESLQQGLRFRSLLSIASDWYWEQDTQNRFTQITQASEAKPDLCQPTDLGQTCWTLSGVDPIASDWDAHRALLATRQPFRDFRVYRSNAAGERVALSLSGEPMFDARGRFTGYWGVARNVTEEERAQAALREGDARFRELFLLSPSPFILHRQGRVLLGNHAAAALFGFATADHFQGFELALLTAPTDRALSQQRIDTLERLPVGGAVPTVELAMQRLDGTPLTVEARVVRVELPDGPASLSLYFDLTERKEAEAQLERSRTMFLRLFHANPDYATVSDIDTGYLEMVNEGFERLTGYTQAEATGRTVSELGLWPQPEQRKVLSEAVRHQGLVRDVPAMLRRRDGQLRKVLFCAARFDWEGRPWMVVTARDITESERERMQYEAILSSALVGVALIRGGVFEHVNLAFERMLGWPRGELVGQSDDVLWPTEADQAEVQQSTQAALDQGQAVDLERTVKRRDGSTFICRFQARAIDPNAPHTSGTLWIAEDVTERRAEQQRLARSETLLSLVMESNPDYVALSELDTGRFLMVNEGFCRMTGYSREQAYERTANELGIWQTPEHRLAFVAQLKQHGAVHAFPTQMRTKDGRLLSALISATAFALDGKMVVTSTARDVTQSERDRQEYEAILTNASIGIAFTRDEHFAHVNPRFAEMFGWPASALAGQSARVIGLSDDDDLQRKLCLGATERRVRRRDGSEFWCRLQVRAVDPAEPGLGAIWIADDITEQRSTQHALASAKADAEAASRAKSAFLANTSHEIRTPLNGLLGLARLALEPKVSDTQRVDYLKTILSSAEQLAGLISDILDLSKIEAGKLKLEAVPFDLHALLANVYAGYRELGAEKGLTCTLHLDARVPQRVVGDAMRVRQIISNFVSNALKFTERGYVDLCAEALADGRIRLAVVDTGLGIDAATQTRLFTPFTQADESTTRRFGGTGLGLSICRQIAQLMGGQVGVDSEPGTGSTFWAELPLSTAPSTDTPQVTPTEQEISLTGVRVLLVEDNAVNMLIAATMLENWGAVVTQAADGKQAVDLISARQDNPATAFDVVLMDVHMPVMSGHDATIALRQRYTPAQLPIVALTAAALLNEQDASMALGMNDFITKPIDARRLGEVVARWGKRRQ